MPSGKSTRRRGTGGSRRTGWRSDAGPSPLPPDWIELLVLLHRHGVEHIVVGAYAVIQHTEPRSTEDLDVFVRPSRANTARLRRALRDFMGEEAATGAIALYRPGTVLMLGRPPWRIDILNRVDGLRFETAWRTRVLVDLGQVQPAVPDLNSMIRAKRAVVLRDRPEPKGSQDRADLARLLFARDRARRSGR